MSTSVKALNVTSVDLLGLSTLGIDTSFQVNALHGEGVITVLAFRCYTGSFCYVVRQSFWRSSTKLVLGIKRQLNVIGRRQDTCSLGLGLHASQAERSDLIILVS